MNSADIASLIPAITALVVAVTGLITLLVHIKNNKPITPDNPATPPEKPGIISPTRNDWQ